MSTIDTDQIYTTAGYEYRFNSDGQAFLLDGRPANGITIGANPIPPCEDCLSFIVVFSPDNHPVCCKIIDDPIPIPINITPEPNFWFLTLIFITAIIIFRKRKYK